MGFGHVLLAVPAPGRIELHQDVLGLVQHHALEVVGDNHLQRSSKPDKTG